MFLVKILLNDLDLQNRVQGHKKCVQFITNFSTMCYFVICSNIQNSIKILVINYELVSDPLYDTYLTFDLDLFYLFSILTLTLKMGKNPGKEISN